MKERPIIFSAEMVRAILEGRKTQTRRVLKPQPPEDIEHFWFADQPLQGNWETGLWYPVYYPGGRGEMYPCGTGIHCPYGVVGDRLWVRETTRIRKSDPPTATYVASLTPVIGVPSARYPHWLDRAIWWYSRDVCPSIHMPKAMTRIWLEIVSERAERLQGITIGDIMAEGIDPSCDVAKQRKHRVSGGAFVELWDKLNAKRGHPFSANDWVWVVEFQRL